MRACANCQPFRRVDVQARTVAGGSGRTSVISGEEGETLTEEPVEIPSETGTSHLQNESLANIMLPLPLRSESKGLDKSHSLQGALLNLGETIESYIPTCSTVLKSLPIPLLPFAFSMFILVQGLVNTGWVKIFAHWWTVLEGKTGVGGGAVVMVVISSLLCNVSVLF